MKPTTVTDILNAMDAIAPLQLAENWDNSGLQVGHKNWQVKTIGVALDPLPVVIKYACSEGIDLLITHHPLIFNPLKSIDISTPTGKIIALAISHKIAIYSAHTNFDSVSGGLNDILACKIGLKNLKILGKTLKPELCKLVIFVPVAYEETILNALFSRELETQAGKIGKYRCCSFRSTGKGTFNPDSSAEPFYGQADRVNHVNEVRIETVVQKKDLGKVIRYIKKIHPYETMAYDAYPLTEPATDIIKSHGIGRIGELENKTELSLLGLELKKKLNINNIKLAGKPDHPVKKIAICTGSGSGLMDNFLASGADVYISGDFKYHDARTVEALNLGLIDIGHFNSEQIIIKALASRLETILTNAGHDVDIKELEIEKDPFYIL